MRLLSLSLFMVVLIGVSESQPGTSSRQTKVVLPARGLCAHRGAMDTHPENTLSAFREAIRCGAHMIEFDVQLTKDRKLVVIHDTTVDRTTDGKGKVSDLTLKKIRQLDAGAWKSPEFAGEKIPTLQETLAVMPKTIWLNVHLYGGKKLGKRVAQVIAREGRCHQAFLACGAAAAKKAKATVRGIMICNMDRQADSWDYVKKTITMKADFIQLCGTITPHFRKYAEKLRENGIRVNYFGTDSPDELRTLFGMGVEFPLVNKIRESMKIAESLGIQPVKPSPGRPQKNNE